MVLRLAGPVFAEWYWGPIFFVVISAQFVLLASAVITAGIIFLRKRIDDPLSASRATRLFFGLIPLLFAVAAVALYLTQ